MSYVFTHEQLELNRLQPVEPGIGRGRHPHRRRKPRLHLIQEVSRPPPCHNKLRPHRLAHRRLLLIRRCRRRRIALEDRRIRLRLYRAAAAENCPPHSRLSAARSLTRKRLQPQDTVSRLRRALAAAVRPWVRDRPSRRRLPRLPCPSRRRLPRLPCTVRIPWPQARQGLGRRRSWAGVRHTSA